MDLLLSSLVFTSTSGLMLQQLLTDIYSLTHCCLEEYLCLLEAALLHLHITDNQKICVQEAKRHRQEGSLALTASCSMCMHTWSPTCHAGIKGMFPLLKEPREIPITGCTGVTYHSRLPEYGAHWCLPKYLQGQSRGG